MDIVNHAVESVLKSFINDTYLTDQNTCTSPEIVFWTGNSIFRAKKVFWEGLYKLVEEKHDIQSV